MPIVEPEVLMDGGHSIERCYVGPGTLLDLNEDCGVDGSCDESPEQTGQCADCHAPGIDGELGGRDLLEATELSYDYGVHCDVCHRTDAVDPDAASPGVAGKLMLTRPSEVSSSPTLGDAWAMQARYRRRLPLQVPASTKSAAASYRVRNLFPAQQRADRLVAGRQPFCNGYDVGPNSLLFVRHHRASASCSTHDLVENQKHPVLIADFANALEVSRHRRNGTRRGADDGLRDEGSDIFRAKLLDKSSALR